MQIIDVRDGDQLEFEFTPGGEMRRVKCQEFGEGQMLLLHRVVGSPFYKALVILKDDQFCQPWPDRPGVRLRYFPDNRNIWKISCEMDAAIKVTRKRS